MYISKVIRRSGGTDRYLSIKFILVKKQAPSATAADLPDPMFMKTSWCGARNQRPRLGNLQPVKHFYICIQGIRNIFRCRFFALMYDLVSSLIV